MPTLSCEAVYDAVRARLIEAGATEKNASLQAEMLVEAERRGLPSHGVQRLPRLLRRIANGVCDPIAEGKHRWRTGAWLDVDGGNGLGPVVVWNALEAASAVAATLGVAVVTINSSNHLGMLALYSERLAIKGQVCIAMTTSEALVHPYGGSTAAIGTNPIAIGIPSTDEPVVLDMATSLVSMGKVHDYAAKGIELPDGWAHDKNGQPTNDATAAMAGSIAPFGGPKGYALGVTLELLVAGLTGTSYGSEVRGTLDDDHRATKGDFFIILQPETAAMARSTAEFSQDLRDSMPADSGNPVKVPGDRSREAREQSATAGLNLTEQLWAELTQPVPGTGEE